ncbi:MAG: hypothetical protein ACYC4J_06640 [Gemmatimonadaceae bacterium]
MDKKLIYLDQMVMSNMAKALDPEWRQEKERDHTYWLALFDQLERLVKLQLVACPESTLHERESSVLAYAEAMRQLYEHFAVGVRFDYPAHILERQLHHAFEAWVRGEAPDFLSLNRQLLIEGSTSTWPDRVRVSVRFPTPATVIDERRTARDETGEAMRQLWERWATEKDVSFADRHRHERGSLFHILATLFDRHQQSLAQMFATGEMPEDVINPRLEVGIVQGLLRRLQDDGNDERQAHARVAEFLQSEAAVAAPANDISAMLYAALARKAAAGQKKVPSRGTPTDITAISCFLPYCDAMFLDDQFAGLLQEEPLRSRLAPYGTRIFSNRTRDAFLEYLREIEAAAQSDHVALVKRVYGDDWLVPYREMLEHDYERRRKQGRS